LDHKPPRTGAKIGQAMAGNLCLSFSCPRIRVAIHAAVQAC
jgi:hypothetical protein